jgi:excisionase family DNA binding protein
MEPTPDDSTPALLTIAATTKRFGISRSQIYRMLNDGRVRGKKIGRSTCIIAESVEAAIKDLPEYRDA